MARPICPRVVILLGILLAIPVLCPPALGADTDATADIDSRAAWSDLPPSSQSNGTGVFLTRADVTVWTGEPAVRERLTDPAAVRRAKRSGTLTRRASLVPTETLVLELRMPGLDSRLANASGANETMRFFDAVHGSGNAISLEQTNPNTMQDEKRGLLNQSAATTVVTDPANDTYYLILDLTAMAFGRDGVDGFRIDRDDPLRIRDREDWALKIGMDGRTLELPRESSDRESLFVLPYLSAWFETPDSEAIAGLPRRTNQEIRVTGALPPATNVTIRVDNRSDGGPPLSKTVRTTSNRSTTGYDGFSEWDDEARVSFDFSGFQHGTTFEMSATVRNWTVDRWRGSIRLDTQHLSLPEPARWADGQATVSRVSVEEPVYLVALDGRWRGLFPTEDELYVGHTELEAGTHEDVPIEILSDRLRYEFPRNPVVTVVAVVDANGNGHYDAGDRPLVRNGKVVGATVEAIQNATLGPEPPDGPTQTHTETTVTSTATPGSTTVRTEPTTGPSPTTTDSTGPGFGLLVVMFAVSGLLALLGRTSVDSSRSE